MTCPDSWNDLNQEECRGAERELLNMRPVMS
jgi:hypothetical protein